MTTHREDALPEWAQDYERRLTVLETKVSLAGMSLPVILTAIAVATAVAVAILK